MQVTAHVRRIEQVEKDLKALTGTSATKDDQSRLRAEMKKIYDGLHIGESLDGISPEFFVYRLLAEFLDLRSHVWGIRELLHTRIFQISY